MQGGLSEAKRTCWGCLSVGGSVPVDRQKVGLRPALGLGRLGQAAHAAVDHAEDHALGAGDEGRRGGAEIVGKIEGLGADADEPRLGKLEAEAAPRASSSAGVHSWLSSVLLRAGRTRAIHRRCIGGDVGVQEDGEAASGQVVHDLGAELVIGVHDDVIAPAKCGVRRSASTSAAPSSPRPRLPQANIAIGSITSVPS